MQQTRVAAREKKKALGPCELKALLRDPVESMHEAQPSATHMAPRDLAIRQRQLCSGARPSAQPTSLARQDRNYFRSLQGRVTTATSAPKHRIVSAMLTESDSSIALPVRHFKGLDDEMGGARQQARHFGVLSVLTARGCD